MKTLDTDNYKWHDMLEIVLPIADTLQLSTRIQNSVVGSDELDQLKAISKAKLEERLALALNPELRKDVQTWYGDHPEAIEDEINSVKEDFENLDAYFSDVRDGFTHHDIIKGSVFERALIAYRVEHHNEVTRLPLFRNFVFRLNDEIKEFLYAMEDQFEMIHLNGFELEDPAFFVSDRLVSAICSHEGLSCITLTEQEVVVNQVIIEKAESESKDTNLLHFSLPESYHESLLNQSMDGTLSDDEFISFVLEHGELCDEEEDVYMTINLDDYNAFLKKYQ